MLAARTEIPTHGSSRVLARSGTVWQNGLRNTQRESHISNFERFCAAWPRSVIKEPPLILIHVGCGMKLGKTGKNRQTSRTQNLLDMVQRFLPSLRSSLPPSARVQNEGSLVHVVGNWSLSNHQHPVLSCDCLCHICLGSQPLLLCACAQKPVKPRINRPPRSFTQT